MKTVFSRRRPHPKPWPNYNNLHSHNPRRHPHENSIVAMPSPIGLLCFLFYEMHIPETPQLSSARVTFQYKDSLSWHRIPMKANNYHDANFIITCSTRGCLDNNFHCHRRWQRVGIMMTLGVQCPIRKIRESWDHLIFIIGISVLEKNTPLYWNNPLLSAPKN